MSTCVLNGSKQQIHGAVSLRRSMFCAILFHIIGEPAKVMEVGEFGGGSKSETRGILMSMSQITTRSSFVSVGRPRRKAEEEKNGERQNCGSGILHARKEWMIYVLLFM